ncbi:hypothetical protein MMC27_004103 [Xylographa pallens]|nr:hypothetical protein [Xylographa pallens]
MPEDAVSTIKYIKELELYEREKPFQILIDIPKSAPDQRYTNLVYEDREETFHDVRGKETTFTLNDHGFTYRRHNFEFDDYEDREAVEANYLPKVEEFIKAEVEDVDKVFFFDWRLRHNASLPKGTIIDLNDPTDWLLPAVHAHVDQSPGAALSRTLLQLPEEADFLLRGRVRIITVWKPLRNRVEDWPLAVCDGSNVEEDDLLETDHIRRQYNGANMNALYREKYKWYYLRRQGPDEPLLLKQFDSATDVKAIRAPHVSFEHRHVRVNAPKRESIEVRALVYTFPRDNAKPL